MFLIDIELMVYRLLPVLLRTTFHIKWLAVLLRPFVTLNQEYAALRNLTVRQLTYSAQSLSLAQYLTEELSTTVQIENNFIAVQEIYLSRAALQPQDPTIRRASEGDGELLLGRASEISVTAQYNFEVHVPAAFTQDDRLNAVIDPYLLAGATYEIVKDL